MTKDCLGRQIKHNEEMQAACIYVPKKEWKYIKANHKVMAPYFYKIVKDVAQMIRYDNNAEQFDTVVKSLQGIIKAKLHDKFDLKTYKKTYECLRHEYASGDGKLIDGQQIVEAFVETYNGIANNQYAGISDAD